MICKQEPEVSCTAGSRVSLQVSVNRSAGFLWNLMESNKFRRFQLNYELQAGHRYSIWVSTAPCW